MAIYQRPGVYVEETLNPLPPVVGGTSTSVAAFIGASDRGPVTPTLVTSWSQYLTKFGGWNSINSNDLPLAVYLFFTNGGSSAYIQRAVGSSSSAASIEILNEDEDLTLTVTAINPGTWGNSISVSVSNIVDLNQDALNPNYVYDLVVYYGGVTSAYSVERYSGVSNDPANPRFVDNVVQSNYIQVVSENIDPAGTGPTPVTLLGGLDGTTVTESVIVGELDKFDTVLNSLILNAAGVTTAANVNQVISYAEGRQDVFVVIDPSGSTSANQISTNATYTASSLAASYYPKIVISDPTVSTVGATKSVSPSGAIIGLYSTTDTSRGVYKAPAGLQARLAGVVSVPTLTNSELDAMNTATSPVNAIRFIPGSGVVVMGSRTLKLGYVDRYVPVRRTLIYLRKALTDLTQYAIFEPNDQRLWAGLEDITSKFLTNFWKEGGLRGASASQAFFVKCDAENNTTSSIDAGEVNIEIGVALQRPAEYVIIKIGQYEGGTTVTVA